MSEEIFQKEFWQAKKRSHKLSIEQKHIDSIKKISLDMFDDEECEKIWQLHKELLGISMKKNNSNETGILVNLMDWTHETVYGAENGISLRNNMKTKEMLLTAPKNSLLFFHNHPKNSVFSEQDLESFMTADSILLISVVCNNGQQYFLSKAADFNKETALNYYNKIFEETEENSVKEFLRTCKQAGLIFQYGGV